MDWVPAFAGTTGTEKSMLAVIRRLKTDERGQAIIIAAVGLLIMAIGVLATAQMGFAVFEKQKLQTIADANAYSLATMQARALNFFAFTNRAMVVHYVTMMHLQAIISALTLAEAILGKMADMANFVYTSGCCPPDWDPGCFAIDIYLMVEPLRQSLSPTLDTLDEIVHQAIDTALVNLNVAVAAAQNAMKIGMGFVTATGLLQQVSWKSDPDIDIGVSQAVTGLANGLTWLQLFDKESDGNRLPDPSTAPEDQKKAMRLMAEVINATRDPTSVIPNRNPFGMAIPELDKFPGLNTLTHGQTKMMTKQDPTYIDQKCYYDSELAEGTAMTSRDVAGFGFGGWLPSGLSGALSPEVSVQNAPLQKGRHVRYDRNQSNTQPQVCLGSINRTPFDDIKEDKGDRRHDNWKGMGKFVSLNREYVKDWKKDFGQPGVVIWLNKKTDKLVREGLTQKFRIDAPSWQSEINTRIGEKGLLSSLSFTGINAIAAAQVYYHRPGNWAEMPNLFNPFWRARLYPVTNYVQFATTNGLPGIVATLIQNMLLIH